MNNCSTLAKISYYRWPLGIVAFFICLASFNFYLAMTAFSHIPDKVDSSPYEQGLHYQAVIDRLGYAKELGLTAKLNFGAPDSKGVRQVHLELFSNSSLAQSDISEIQISAMRPNSSSDDTKAELTHLKGSPKSFVGNMKLPLSGMWLIQIHVTIGDRQALIKTRELL